MAKFVFDKNFSDNKIVIFCKTKLELMETLYHHLYVKIKDLKILPNPDGDNYLVIMIAPYRDRLLLGYVNDRLE